MTIDLKFKIGDKVKILPFSCEGIVLAIFITKNGTEYQIRYYMDSKVLQEYFFESELKKL
jgi:hypothetical protein